MSQASFDSDSGVMFESEDFDARFDSGGLEDAGGGMMGQSPNEVAMAPAGHQLPIKKKGFTLDSFLLLVSMLLMLTSAIILFTYLNVIDGP